MELTRERLNSWYESKKLTEDDIAEIRLDHLQGDADDADRDEDELENTSDNQF